MDLDLATLQEIFEEKLAPAVVQRIHNSCSPQAAWEQLVRLTESEAAGPLADSLPGPELPIKHLHMTEKGHQWTTPERTRDHAVVKFALATATPVRLNVNTCDSEIPRLVSVAATSRRGVVGNPKLPPSPPARNRGAHSCGHSLGYDSGNRPEPVSLVKSRQYWPLDGCRLPLPTDKHGTAARTLNGDQPVLGEDTRGARPDCLADIMPVGLPVASGFGQAGMQPFPDGLPAQLDAKLALIGSPENGGAWTPPAKSPPSRNRSPMAGARTSLSNPGRIELPTAKPFRPTPAADIDINGQPPAGASSDTRTAQQDSAAVDILGDIFPSLSTLVPEVLEACGHDSTKAFEKLQDMQYAADDAAHDWDSIPHGSATEPEVAPDNSTALAQQFPSLPKGVIEEALRKHMDNLNQACIALTMLCDTEEDTRVATDRALAVELTNNPGHIGAAAATPPSLEPGQPVSMPGWFDGLDKVTRQRVQYLSSCFPTADLDAVKTALEVSEADVELAREVLRDNGFAEELDQSRLLPVPGTAPPPKASPAPPVQTVQAQPLSSEPSRQTATLGSGSVKQQIYMEERTISHSYQEKIKDLISKIDTLKKEGRHLDASVCQSQIYQLKKAERQEREKAGQRIMKKVNEGTVNSFTLDLHGQHPEEAVAQIDKRVEYAVRGFDDIYWCVITGKGNHSRDGPKVQPAVIDYLKQRGLAHSVNDRNAGEVNFRVTPGQQLKPYCPPWKRPGSAASP